MVSEGMIIHINGGMNRGSALRKVQQSVAVIHALLEGPDQSERTKRISCTAKDADSLCAFSSFGSRN